MEEIDAQRLAEILTDVSNCAPSAAADEVADELLYAKFNDVADRVAIRNAVRRAYHVGLADEFCAQNAITSEERAIVAARVAGLAVV